LIASSPAIFKTKDSVTVSTIVSKYFYSNHPQDLVAAASAADCSIPAIMRNIESADLFYVSSTNTIC
jgi:hypothetical protein